MWKYKLSIDCEFSLKDKDNAMMVLSSVQNFIMMNQKQWAEWLSKMDKENKFISDDEHKVLSVTLTDLEK